MLHPYNVVVFFEPTSAANTYNLTFMVQAALRYPANTLLIDLSKPHIKTKSDKFINDVVEHVEGSKGVPRNGGRK